MDALRKCSRVGSDAFVNAVLAGIWTTGLEDLELAQGILWSQRLHYRDPLIRNVPPSLATELVGLINAISSQSTWELNAESIPSGLTPRDVVHGQRARIYDIVREIRALPGLDRFMLGETYEDLCKVATAHPVVVIVGARSHTYALIINPEHIEVPELLELHLNAPQLQQLSSSPSS